MLMMKLKTKIFLINFLVLFIFAITLIVSVPIIQSVYIKNEEKTLLNFLEQSVEKEFASVVKFGNDEGYASFEVNATGETAPIAFPEPQSKVESFEKSFDNNYLVKSSDERILFIKVNENSISKFINRLTQTFLLLFFFVVFLDVVIMHLILKGVISPISRIVDHVENINQLRFEPIDANEHTWEFDQLQNSLNSVDFTLHNFFKQRHALAQSLSHELKSPVAVISSTLELHARKIKGYEEFSDIQRIIDDNLHKIQENATYAMRIFDRDTILQKVPINFYKVIENKIVSWQSALTLKELEIQVMSDESTILFDEEMLSLILDTIFQNMVKHAEPHSKVNVKISDGNLSVENEISKTDQTGTNSGLKLAQTLAIQNEYFLIQEKTKKTFITKFEKNHKKATTM